MGTIFTLAGNFSLYGLSGTVSGGGYGGDGGPANLAQFAGSINQGVGPVGIQLDGLGNIYIGDTGNNRIRKLYHACVGYLCISNGVKFSNGVKIR